MGETLDLLRHPVFEDLELLSGAPFDRLGVATDDGHVEVDELGLGAKRGWLGPGNRRGISQNTSKGAIPIPRLRPFIPASLEPPDAGLTIGG